MALGGSGLIRVSVGSTDLNLRVRELATFGHNIETLEPAWEQVGEDFLDDFKRNFAAEGGFFGQDFAGNKAWEQLMPSTVQDRIRHGYGGAHPILERTGFLRASVTERGAEGNIFQASATGLTVGTSDPVAVYHQYGSADGIRLPARPLVGLTWDRRSGILDRIRAYIKAQVEATGLQG